MNFAYLIEPPFNDRDEDGRVTGCHVELARAVLETVGVADVSLIEAEFADLLPGLADGRWQMTTGLFVTEERRRIAAFSRPIWALPDGLLVRRGNPLALTGYRSVAVAGGCRLAVVGGQVQHATARQLGVPEERITIVSTYAEAAGAVLAGEADAAASVERAHIGFLAMNGDLALDTVAVGPAEKQPAFGAFAFAPGAEELRRAVDDALAAILGSPAHRAMMAGLGFSDAEVDLVAG